MNNIRYISTRIPDVDTKIIINNSKSRVAGYLIDHKTRQPLEDPNRSRRKRKVPNPLLLEAKIRELLTALEDQFRMDHNEKTSKSPAGFFSSAYQNLKDPTVLIQDMGSSAKSALTYFVRNVLPLMDQYGIDIRDEDMETIKAELLKKAYQHGNSNKDGMTDRNFEARLGAINTILHNLQMECPDLPQVLFLRVTTAVARIKEQIKSIPEECRVRISHILLREVEDHEEALASAGMDCGGLRTGEAAAVNFGQIKCYGHFAILYVEYRIDDNGNRVELLKTDQAYRLIVLPYFYVVLYNRRRARLRSQGYTDAEIDQMPILNLEGGNSSRLSTYCRDLLLRAGITDAQMASIRQLMHREPDVVDSIQEKDVSAYILRRDWATRMSACCGMPYDDVDYYIGHRNDKVHYADYLDLAKCEETARVMERYVFLPEYSYHPAYTQGSVAAPQIVTLDPVTGGCIRNDSNTPMMVELRIKALEPGTETRFVLPRTPSTCRTVCRDDDPASREVRPILGKVYPPEHYTER